MPWWSERLRLWLAQQPLSFEADATLAVIAHVDGQDRTVKVEVYLPSSNGDARHPAILLLHGVEGAMRYRSAHTLCCRGLADQGYAVFYVHYFDSVDYEDLWHLRPDGSLDRKLIESRCWRDAPCWSESVIDVLSEISRRPDVDPGRIAVYGMSLGGFVAMEVADEASRRPEVPDLRAVVVNWGAQFKITKCRAGFPPTLHIHGELDEVVPLADALASVTQIQAVGTEAELIVIPGAPHVARSRESSACTTAFLRRHLQPSSR